MNARMTPLVRNAVVNSGKPGQFPAVHGLHHVAYRCRDAEETRRFYEDLLGLPLVEVIEADTVPSSGELTPFYHLFFELADGSCVAFFDLLDGKSNAKDPDTPYWVNHLALEVDSVEALNLAKTRLQEAGVLVAGVIEHESGNRAIYFSDPNGVRLEFNCRGASLERRRQVAREARAVLDGRLERIQALKKKAGTHG